MQFLQHTRQRSTVASDMASYLLSTMAAPSAWHTCVMRMTGSGLQATEEGKAPYLHITSAYSCCNTCQYFDSSMLMISNALNVCQRRVGGEQPEGAFDQELHIAESECTLGNQLRKNNKFVRNHIINLRPV